MKNIILLAPSAAGKGTLASMLQDHLGYISISTGDLLREKAKTDMELQNKMKLGKLIDDEIVFSLLEEKLKVINNNPYILDGFPRTVNQAIMYDSLLNKLNKELGVVIYLDVDRDELLTRVTTRTICPQCKKSYSTINKELMPKEEGICDICKVALITRSDDTKEVFNERYEEFLNKTNPLVDYYTNKNILYKITSIEALDTYSEALKIIK